MALSAPKTRESDGREYYTLAGVDQGRSRELSELIPGRNNFTTISLPRLGYAIQLREKSQHCQQVVRSRIFYELLKINLPEARSSIKEEEDAIVAARIACSFALLELVVRTVPVQDRFIYLVGSLQEIGDSQLDLDTFKYYATMTSATAHAAAVHAVATAKPKPPPESGNAGK